MPSIHPATNAVRYVDLREALNDQKLTQPEVEKYIAPHYRDMFTDAEYLKTLRELSLNQAKTGLGPVHTTAPAQKSLESLLKWEGVAPQRPNTGE